MQTTTALAAFLAPTVAALGAWTFKRPRQALQRWIRSHLPSRLARMLSREV
jgi:hypothetical protein